MIIGQYFLFEISAICSKPVYADILNSMMNSYFIFESIPLNFNLLYSILFEQK